MFLDKYPYPYQTNSYYDVHETNEDISNHHEDIENDFFLQNGANDKRDDGRSPDVNILLSKYICKNYALVNFRTTRGHDHLLSLSIYN